MDVTQAYLEDFTRLTELYIAEEYPEAIEFTRTMEARHGWRRTSIRHLRACLFAADGRVEQGLDVMREVVADGLWWRSHLLADRDLDPLRNSDEFAALARLMGEREQAARQMAVHATPRVVLLDPPSTDPSALVVALHMYGVDARATASRWAAARDVAVALPDSPLRDADDLGYWDDRVAEKAVHEAVRLLRRGGERDGAPLVLAGASQGAKPASRLAISGSFEQCSGFLCIAGAPHLGGLEAELRAARRRGLKGFMICGSRDQFVVDEQRRAQRTLVASGIPTKLFVVDGLGHDYPDDFGALLAEAVKFLITT